MMRTTTLCDQIRNIFIELDLRLKSKLHANQLPTNNRRTSTDRDAKAESYEQIPINARVKIFELAPGSPAVP